MLSISHNPLQAEVEVGATNVDEAVLKKREKMALAR